MNKKSTNLDLSANVIDVRDIIERVEELEGDRNEQAEASGKPDSWAADFPEDADELSTLTAILDELKGYSGDEQWRGEWYPITLIRDDYFEDHARELAEDIGAIKRDAQWPNNHIDWTAAAEALQVDYGSVDIEGTDYWYRWPNPPTVAPRRKVAGFRGASSNHLNTEHNGNHTVINSHGPQGRTRRNVSAGTRNFPQPETVRTK